MVDELELLKKDWQKQEASLPKLTKQEIYPMLLKKSSSIVKWIFIISILEFVFWLFLSFAIGDGDAKNFEKEVGLETFDTIILITHILALIFFIGWFYKNYRKIEATDSSRVLMQNIIKTRKTVKYYIWFSMLFLAVASIAAYSLMLRNNPDKYADENLFVLTLAFVGIIGIAILLMWVFYRLIYGILMKRLDRNYKELRKMEV